MDCQIAIYKLIQNLKNRNYNHPKRIAPNKYNSNYKCYVRVDIMPNICFAYLTSYHTVQSVHICTVAVGRLF